MVMRDAIADLVSCMGNVKMVGDEKLEVGGCKMKKEMGEVLKGEGLIGDVEYMEDNKEGIFRIF
uniref:30S ribosomal protein S8 n=1 Tax=Bacillus thuringiensis TaxID=1428 RepID=UPI0011A7FC8A